MRWKFACGDFCFPLLSHDQVLDLIALLDFQGVDLGLFSERSHVQPEDVMRNVPAAARELALKLDDRGLAFADVYLQQASDFVSLAVNHPEPKKRRKSREIFLRILEFTARVNGHHMSGLPGVAWEKEKKEDSLARAAEELVWRVEQARQVGVVFSVEAHIGSIVPTPAEAKQLVEMTPGLTLTLDYGHFTYQGIADSKIEPLVQYASHFHARGGCKGRLQAPLKDNTIDYARILHKMHQVKYKGYLGLEYVWIDWERCNEVDNISETVMLRSFLEKVKLPKKK